MSDQTVKSEPVKAVSASPKPARDTTRITVIVIVMILTIAAFAIGIPWGRYRYKHVVVGEASVKGIVTKIGGRMEGRIKSVDVQVGQHVSKGQILLRLEDSHLQAALERAKAELESASKELESEKKG